MRDKIQTFKTTLYKYLTNFLRSIPYIIATTEHHPTSTFVIAELHSNTTKMMILIINIRIMLVYSQQYLIHAREVYISGSTYSMS